MQPELGSVRNRAGVGGEPGKWGSCGELMRPPVRRAAFGGRRAPDGGLVGPDCSWGRELAQATSGTAMIEGGVSAGRQLTGWASTATDRA